MLIKYSVQQIGFTASANTCNNFNQPVMLAFYQFVQKKSLRISISSPSLEEIFATCCIFLFYYSLFSPRIQSQRHFYKRFLQHVALFSSKIAFFFLAFTLNTVSARDFCNMLHFSLLNSPFSYQHSISALFLQEIFATCCTFLFFKIIIFFFKNAKAPEAGQACFRGNHDKFYFAFGPRPYFFR